MPKFKKLLSIVLAICLLLGGLWFYWGWQVPLMELLPQDTWTKVRVWKGEMGEGEWEIEAPPLEAVLAAMEQTEVDRNDKDKLLGDTYFRVALYREGAQYPTLLHVLEYGKLSIAVDYDLGNYQYYEHAEELYEALANLTADSAVKE
ncbi:MAG: hypothetical protein UEP57_02205 [Oscillospiraceae bacterium]|nr:hypothetical protein [Oscillospiraceae bacterium]